MRIACATARAGYGTGTRSVRRQVLGQRDLLRRRAGLLIPVREGFAVATSLARQTPQSFVFEQHEFVIWVMRLARSHGTDILRKLVSALYCAAVSGSRSGVPGEPFPQDIKLRDRAAEVLSGLTRQDPAYELYSDLHRHAIQSIKMQEEEGRMMAEMDE